MAERTKYMLPDILFAMAAVRDLRWKRDRNPREEWLFYCLNHGQRSHGQFFQDLWVLHELEGKRGGFFVEFGAANGLRHSNTLLLEREYGWTGILAEPARVWYPAIRKNRTCSIDDRCVWPRTGETVTFVEAEIALQSTAEQHLQADGFGHERVPTNRYEVGTVSLNDLLAGWNAPTTIDYLSMDSEGSELEILKTFDFETWDVRLISVEHNFADRRAPLHELLSAKGYRRVLEGLSSVDDWYVKA